MLVDGMVVAQDRRGLVLWPLAEVAMVRVEYAGRLEVLHASGAMAHAVWALPDAPPLIPLDDRTLVHPGLVRRESADLVLPGGWRISHATPLPDPAPPTETREEPLGPGGPLPAEVLYFEWRYGRGAWVTASGTHPWRGTREEAEAAHGRLVPLDSRSVNLVQVDGVRSGILCFRDGSSFKLRPEPARLLARALGVGNLREAGRQTARQRALFRLGLQDWPTELMEADDAWLQEEFRGDLLRLLANLIWQVFRRRAQGLPDEYGRDHRGLFYRPVQPVVVRAGLRGSWAAALGPELLGLSPDDRISVAMLKILDRMVMDDRLFTFGELGFDSARPDLRGAGATRPWILVLAEKQSLRREVLGLESLFGMSWLILGGQPSAFGTELLVDLLRPVLRGRPVLVVALVDFDPSGWVIAEAFCQQAKRFGLRIAGLRFLVRPERFGAEELARIAVPLEPAGPGGDLKLQHWLERSGGVAGKPLGIYADYLRPMERVARAFQEETGT